MTSLFFDHVLQPEGWARDVRMQLQGGTIASIEQGAAPQAEDIRCLLYTSPSPRDS